MKLFMAWTYWSKKRVPEAQLGRTTRDPGLRLFMSRQDYFPPRFSSYRAVINPPLPLFPGISADIRIYYDPSSAGSTWIVRGADPELPSRSHGLLSLRFSRPNSIFADVSKYIRWILWASGDLTILYPIFPRINPPGGV